MDNVRGKHLQLVGSARRANTGLMASVASAPSATSTPSVNALIASRRARPHHWPEYSMEAFGLGLFLLSACVFGAILDYPGSPVRQAIPNGTVRRVLFGAAMALTNILNIYAPWGRRSGAHLNPAVTWTFYRLGKVERGDAVFYTLAQFAGGILGVFVARIFLRPLIAHPAVNYVATTPGSAGVALAFVAEVAMTFILMTVILVASNMATLTRYTGILASLLVMTYICVEAPLSGMSMNAARTLGSAVFAGTWTALWIYFVAPLLGMLLAAEVYLRLKGARQVHCAKLHHDNTTGCIFRCRFADVTSDK